MGQQRPAFAEEISEGQESVWDYPRPPAIVDCNQLVEVKVGDNVIASSTRSKRVLETASPPTVYIPPEDIQLDALMQVAGQSFCEWKGAAFYWGIVNADRFPVGWSYPTPSPAFAVIKNWLCFYPARIECYLDGERVKSQEGGFYGGWVTKSIVGPWKGATNTGHW
ncbi:MAG: DUF427 domain-containing protein [Gammaproteobacteria bacterium]